MTLKEQIVNLGSNVHLKLIAIKDAHYFKQKIKLIEVIYDYLFLAHFLPFSWHEIIFWTF